MKFMSINDNVSVSKEDILSIERMDDNRARVIMSFGQYESNYPYETILQFLEIPDIKEKVSESMSLKEAFHRPQQYWAG